MQKKYSRVEGGSRKHVVSNLEGKFLLLISSRYLETLEDRWSYVLELKEMFFFLVHTKRCTSWALLAVSASCPCPPVWHVKGILHAFREEISTNRSWWCAGGAACCRLLPEMDGLLTSLNAKFWWRLHRDIRLIPQGSLSLCFFTSPSNLSVLHSL